MRATKLQATLLICERIDEHEDGTLTAVRGGITFWPLPTVPGSLAFSVLVQIPRGLPRGANELRMTVAAPNGALVVDAAAHYVVTDPQSPRFLPIRVELEAGGYGDIRIEVTSDDVEGSASLSVRPPDSPQKSTPLN